MVFTSAIMTSASHFINELNQLFKMSNFMAIKPIFFLGLSQKALARNILTAIWSLFAICMKLIEHHYFGASNTVNKQELITTYNIAKIYTTSKVAHKTCFYSWFPIQLVIFFIDETSRDDTSYT